MPLLHMSKSLVAPSFTNCAESFCHVSKFGLICGVCVCDEAKGGLSSAIIPKLYKKVCDCLLIVCP